MKKAKYSLAIAGANGRMGQAVINNASANAAVVTQALVRDGSEAVGKVVVFNPNIYSQQTKQNQSMQSIQQKITYTAAANMCADFDVLIDFSNASALQYYLDKCIVYNRPMVINTTGLNEQQFQLIKAAAKKIAIVYAVNTSIGINLCSKLLETCCKVLGNDKAKQTTDVRAINAQTINAQVTNLQAVNTRVNTSADAAGEGDWQVAVHDIHHQNKKDVPSGTTLQLAKILQAVFPNVTVTSKRIGKVFGEHKVTFRSSAEIIEIKHKALDRSVFAQGSLRAARWVLQQKPGLYGMADFI